MKYACTNCWYVFDEALWDEVEWVENWTKIDCLDCCPVCLENDSFFQIKEEVIYVDENTIDKVEREHLIEIKHDSFNLTFWRILRFSWRKIFKSGWWFCCDFW